MSPRENPKIPCGGAGADALGVDQAHPAAAFDPDVGMVVVAGDLDTDFIGDLDDRLPALDLVLLIVDRDFGHNHLN